VAGEVREPDGTGGGEGVLLDPKVNENVNVNVKYSEQHILNLGLKFATCEKFIVSA
jgi:hypothetical protein